MGEIDISGWQDLIKVYPPKPDGYSTVEEIARKMNVNDSTLSCKLKKLRLAGKVKGIQVRSERGKTIWAYKD